MTRLKGSQESTQRNIATHVSGKYLIIGIVGIALAGAGASWWYRYNATHRMAQFWGPEASRLIRDAPAVALLKFMPSDDEGAPIEELEFVGKTHRLTARIDVSTARGMTHLRNALLEDRSFDGFGLTVGWVPHWGLEFRDGDRTATVLFPETCTAAALHRSDEAVASCRPIADGLAMMFAELMAKPAEPAR